MVRFKTKKETSEDFALNRIPPNDRDKTGTN